MKLFKYKQSDIYPDVLASKALSSSEFQQLLSEYIRASPKEITDALKIISEHVMTSIEHTGSALIPTMLKIIIFRKQGVHHLHTRLMGQVSHRVGGRGSLGDGVTPELLERLVTLRRNRMMGRNTVALPYNTSVRITYMYVIREVLHCVRLLIYLRMPFHFEGIGTLRYKYFNDKGGIPTPVLDADETFVNAYTLKNK